MVPKIKIDITTDTICPWCFVGTKRLLRAMASMPEAQFELEFHPFQLDPTLPKSGVSKMERYEKKFGKERMAAMIPYMQQVGKAEGITFSYGGLISSSFDSHRLIAKAQQAGKQIPFMMSLYRKYFELEQNIGDIEVLAAAAMEATLFDTLEAAKTFLSSEEMVGDVSRGMNYSREAGVHGVPHFVIDGRYHVSGAQEPESFVQIFDKIRAQNIH